MDARFMKTVRLEETENRRTLHIGSYFVDLNESEYRELVKIFLGKLSGTIDEGEIDWGKVFSDWQKKYFTVKDGPHYKKQDFVDYLKENYSCLPIKKEGEWISVEERLPTKSGKYWVYRKGCEKHHFEKWNGSGWAYNKIDITHWMPLPKAPEFIKSKEEGK
jgi:hypothetical protein